jgi:hypothetical protein
MIPRLCPDCLGRLDDFGTCANSRCRHLRRFKLACDARPSLVSAESAINEGQDGISPPHEDRATVGGFHFVPRIEKPEPEKPNEADQLHPFEWRVDDLARIDWRSSPCHDRLCEIEEVILSDDIMVGTRCRVVFVDTGSWMILSTGYLVPSTV